VTGLPWLLRVGLYATVLLGFAVAYALVSGALLAAGAVTRAARAVLVGE
jgi:hypothetical protein